MAIQDIPVNRATASPEEGQCHAMHRQLALETFLCELPDLLQSSRDYWVAYHGNVRLGMALNDDRLIERFALPPEGKQSFWERVLGSARVRYPANDLSLFYVTETSLDYEFDVEQDENPIS